MGAGSSGHVTEGPPFRCFGTAPRPALHTTKTNHGFDALRRSAPVCRLEKERVFSDVDKHASPRGGERFQTPAGPGRGRSMLGRGVKRKWAYLEGALGIGGADAEGAAGASYLAYLQQRQLVLSLGLAKLQSGQGCQIRTEPSLRRSVLLANTMRQIQEEMRQEEADLQQALQIARVSNAVQDPDACLRCSQEGELTVSLIPLSFTLPPSSCSSEDTESSESDNSQRYLSDLALDDIFEDIDTSMYDSTDISSIQAAFHSDCNEGLKQLVSYPPTSALQLCSFPDATELDNLIEILVDS
ncbi:cell division cycle-associated protein 4-like [Denticeps clupeoides]|uniref:SERTA domain-containing protein n=1 Tax=Denticeps clupeoides TaxID=299321 RepID=A0AAY4BYF7_9TELE|nr:cell division cycle-associated protein 4-like [Denticeps clupeoides]